MLTRKTKLAVLIASLTFSGAVLAASTIDMVVAMDESGSMSGEHNAFIGSYVQNLDTILNQQGVTINQYGLMGFGASAYGVAPANEGGREVSSSALYHYFNLSGSNNLGTSTQFSSITNQLVTTGGTEDGYRAMDYILQNYKFRSNAGASIMLITDESRDSDNDSMRSGLTETALMDIENTLKKDKIVVHAVLSQNLTDKSGNPAVAVVGADPNTGFAYVKDSSGIVHKVQGYKILPTGDTKSPSNMDTTTAYTNLALQLGGTVMNIDQLRSVYADPTALASLNQELAQLVASISAGQAPVIGIDCSVASGTAAQICAALGRSSNQGLQQLLGNIGQNGSSANRQLLRLAPRSINQSQQAVLSHTRFMMNFLGQRLSAIRRGAGPRAEIGINDYMKNGVRISGTNGQTGGGASADDNSGTSFYIRGAYSQGHQNSDSVASGYDSDRYTIAAGFDKEINRDFLLGAVFGYTNSDASFNDAGGNSKGDTYSLSGYTSYQFKPNWYFEGILGLGTTDFKTNRETGFGVATSNTNADQWHVSLGVVTELGNQNLSIQPHARLRYTDIRVGGYSESGSPAALQVQGQHVSSTVSELGGTLTKYFDTGWSAFLRASWEHEFDNSGRTVSAAFTADPTTVFDTVSSSQSRDYGIIGIGATKDIGHDRSISVRFDSLVGHQQYRENTLEFKFRQAF